MAFNPEHTASVIWYDNAESLREAQGTDCDAQLYIIYDLSPSKQKMLSCETQKFRASDIDQCCSLSGGVPILRLIN